MWSELKELLVGFVGALIALWAVVILVNLGNRLGAQNEETVKKAKKTKPHEDLHSPIVEIEKGRVSPSSDPRSKRYKPAYIRTMDGPPSVARLFIARKASAPMQEVDQIEAIARRGLRGDRYCEGCGFWSEKDECEITMIAQEDLDDIKQETGIGFDNGAHRRNIVTHNIAMENLIGKRFRIGDAKFAFERPRPPCLHLQTISEPGVVKALVGRSGICVRCFHGGVVKRGDPIILISLSFAAFVKKAARSFWQQ